MLASVHRAEIKKIRILHLHLTYYRKIQRDEREREREAERSKGNKTSNILPRF